MHPVVTASRGSELLSPSLWETLRVSDVTSEIPPGWYPDPSGARQWRVWNGTAWSDVTRSYAPLAETATTDQATAAPSSASTLLVVAALHRLTQFGVLAYYAGFALLVSLISHWPGQPHPVTARFANATLGAAMGLTLIGAISFAVCVYALRGRWTWDALVPFVNTLVASYLISKHLGTNNSRYRVGADAFITVGFVLLCPSEPWVGVALAGVAFTQLARAYVLLDRLSEHRSASASAS